ncbi:MAG: amidohydrolase family protein [Arenicella sp.]|nr:amidohydrolase family protein [Arenicella sp.]
MIISSVFTSNNQKHSEDCCSAKQKRRIFDGRWAEIDIGAERIKTSYAFKSLLDAGASLSFGSDGCVALINPLAGIYAAVTMVGGDVLYSQ